MMRDQEFPPLKAEGYSALLSLAPKPATKPSSPLLPFSGRAAAPASTPPPRSPLLRGGAPLMTGRQPTQPRVPAELDEDFPPLRGGLRPSGTTETPRPPQSALLPLGRPSASVGPVSQPQQRQAAGDHPPPELIRASTPSILTSNDGSHSEPGESPRNVTSSSESGSEGSVKVIIETDSVSSAPGHTQWPQQQPAAASPKKSKQKQNKPLPAASIYLYKTALCWAHPACTNEKCTFAHGIGELRTYRTRMCPNLMKSGGTCEQGDDKCQFAHKAEDLREVVSLQDFVAKGGEGLLIPKPVLDASKRCLSTEEMRELAGLRCPKAERKKQQERKQEQEAAAAARGEVSTAEAGPAEARPEDATGDGGSTKQAKQQAKQTKQAKQAKQPKQPKQSGADEGSGKAKGNKLAKKKGGAGGRGNRRKNDRNRNKNLNAHGQRGNGQDFPRFDMNGLPHGPDGPHPGMYPFGMLSGANAMPMHPGMMGNFAPIMHAYDPSTIPHYGGPMPENQTQAPMPAVQDGSSGMSVGPDRMYCEPHVFIYWSMNQGFNGPPQAVNANEHQQSYNDAFA